MEWSPSGEVNIHSVSQEIPRLLWYQKVCFRVHMTLPLVTILIQISPIHTFPPYFHKFHFNIIFTSTPMCSEWSLPFCLSHQNFLHIFHRLHTCYMRRPSHPLPVAESCIICSSRSWRPVRKLLDTSSYFHRKSLKCHLSLTALSVDPDSHFQVVTCGQYKEGRGVRASLQRPKIGTLQLKEGTLTENTEQILKAY